MLLYHARKGKIATIQLLNSIDYGVDGKYHPPDLVIQLPFSPSHAALGGSFWDGGGFSLSKWGQSEELCALLCVNYSIVAATSGADRGPRKQN